MDELDKAREGRRARRTRDPGIPGLDIGEPEEDLSVAGGGVEGNRIERVRSASASTERGGGLGRSGSVKGRRAWWWMMRRRMGNDMMGMFGIRILKR